MNKLQKGKRIRSFNSNRKNQGKCSTKYLKTLAIMKKKTQWILGPMYL